MLPRHRVFLCGSGKGPTRGGSAAHRRLAERAVGGPLGHGNKGCLEWRVKRSVSKSGRRSRFCSMRAFNALRARGCAPSSPPYRQRPAHPSRPVPQARWPKAGFRKRVRRNSSPSRHERNAAQRQSDVVVVAAIGDESSATSAGRCAPRVRHNRRAAHKARDPARCRSLHVSVKFSRAGPGWHSTQKNRIGNRLEHPCPRPATSR